MSANPTSALRPSNLPKLAVCPCYESNPVAGPAAERGTLLDSAFRAKLLGLDECEFLSGKLSADENSAVAWAVSMIRANAGCWQSMSMDRRASGVPCWIASGATRRAS